jgi:hypothetical protein
MSLWLVNLDPDTTDDELRDLVRSIARLEVASLTRVPPTSPESTRTG